MILSHLWVKNFRNFEELDLELGNLNVIFGANDIGKTNLLQAIRYLLDPQCRRMGFVDSDFYLKDTNNEIEIMLSIDISDEEDDNNKKYLPRLQFLKQVRTSCISS